MRAREITISGAPAFTFELSLLRVSARHPRAVCVTEFVCGFAEASLSWRQCTAATPNMTASCGHQTTTATSSYHLAVVPATGMCYRSKNFLRGSYAAKNLNAIIPKTSKTHVPRVVASRFKFLSTELPPTPSGSSFPLYSILSKV